MMNNQSHQYDSSPSKTQITSLTLPDSIPKTTKATSTLSTIPNDDKKQTLSKKSLSTLNTKGIPRIAQHLSFPDHANNLNKPSGTITTKPITIIPDHNTIQTNHHTNSILQSPIPRSTSSSLSHTHNQQTPTISTQRLQHFQSPLLPSATTDIDPNQSQSTTSHINSNLHSKLSSSSSILSTPSLNNNNNTNISSQYSNPDFNSESLHKYLHRLNPLNRVLVEENSKLTSQIKELEDQNNKLHQLVDQKSLEELKFDNEQLKQTIQALKHDFDSYQDMTQIIQELVESEHQDELYHYACIHATNSHIHLQNVEKQHYIKENEQTLLHQQQIQNIENDNLIILNELKSQHQSNIQSIQQQYDDFIKDLNLEHQNQIQQLNVEINQFHSQEKLYQAEISTIMSQLSTTLTENGNLTTLINQNRATLSKFQQQYQEFLLQLQQSNNCVIPIDFSSPDISFEQFSSKLELIKQTIQHNIEVQNKLKDDTIELNNVSDQLQNEIENTQQSILTSLSTQKSNVLQFVSDINSQFELITNQIQLLHTNINEINSIQHTTESIEDADTNDILQDLPTTVIQLNKTLTQLHTFASTFQQSFIDLDSIRNILSESISDSSSINIHQLQNVKETHLSQPPPLSISLQLQNLELVLNQTHSKVAQLQLRSKNDQDQYTLVCNLYQQLKSDLQHTSTIIIDDISPQIESLPTIFQQSSADLQTLLNNTIEQYSKLQQSNFSSRLSQSFDSLQDQHDSIIQRLHIQYNDQFTQSQQQLVDQLHMYLNDHQSLLQDLSQQLDHILETNNNHTILIEDNDAYTNFNTQFSSLSSNIAHQINQLQNLSTTMNTVLKSIFHQQNKHSELIENEIQLPASTLSINDDLKPLKPQQLINNQPQELLFDSLSQQNNLIHNIIQLLQNANSKNLPTTCQELQRHQHHQHHQSISDEQEEARFLEFVFSLDQKQDLSFDSVVESNNSLYNDHSSINDIEFHQKPHHQTQIQCQQQYKSSRIRTSYNSFPTHSLDDANIPSNINIITTPPRSPQIPPINQVISNISTQPYHYPLTQLISDDLLQLNLLLRLGFVNTQNININNVNNNDNINDTNKSTNNTQQPIMTSLPQYQPVITHVSVSNSQYSNSFPVPLPATNQSQSILKTTTNIVYSPYFLSALISLVLFITSMVTSPSQLIQFVDDQPF